MNTLVEAVRKFVKSAAIKRKIAFFYENHGNGFEKWLQFELMHWLQEKQGHKVSLEAGIAADQRMTSKTKLQVDMLVKMKNQANLIFHAVELKVTKGKSTAMRKAVYDLIRLSKAKDSEWDFGILPMKHNRQTINIDTITLIFRSLRHLFIFNGWLDQF